MSKGVKSVTNAGENVLGGLAKGAVAGLGAVTGVSFLKKVLKPKNQAIDQPMSQPDVPDQTSEEMDQAKRDALLNVLRNRRGRAWTIMSQDRPLGG